MAMVRPDIPAPMITTSCVSLGCIAPIVDGAGAPVVHAAGQAAARRVRQQLTELRARHAGSEAHG
jgi:hypothetical protein